MAFNRLNKFLSQGSSWEKTQKSVNKMRDEIVRIGKNQVSSRPSTGAMVGIGMGVAVGAASAVWLAPVVLAGVGFGTAGVAAGSLAAGLQSSIGAVAAGSWFAACQSAGAAGFAASTVVGIGAAGGTVGGTAGRAFTANLMK